MSHLEDLLLLQLRAAKLPEPEREVRFAPPRRFRFDFCYEDRKLAIEVEGGQWLGKSRHRTGKGYEQDCVKYNLAASLGYTVYRFTGGMIERGEALECLERALRGG